MKITKHRALTLELNDSEVVFLENILDDYLASHFLGSDTSYFAEELSRDIA